MLGYLRLLLALGVVFGHANFVSPGVSRSMVSCFFVISGYLMMLTLDRNYDTDPLPFYWNRILRVYPLYLLVGVLIWLLHPDFIRAVGGGPIDYHELLATGLIWYPTKYNNVMGPAWTLTYELGFYVFAPLLFAAGRRGAILYLVGSVGIFVYYEGILNLLRPFNFGCGSLICGSSSLFAAGALVYHFQKPLSSHLGRGAAYVKLSALGVLIAVLAYCSRPTMANGDFQDFDQAWSPLYNTVAVVSTLCFVLFWNARESAVSKFAGELCYPIYMLHYPIMHLGLSQWTGYRTFVSEYARMFPFAENAWHAVATILIATAVAVVWMTIDRRFIHRLLRSRHATAASTAVEGNVVRLHAPGRSTHQNEPRAAA